MRPYRGKRTDNGKWLCGCLIKRNCDGYPRAYIYNSSYDETEIFEYDRDAKVSLSSLFIEVIPETVGQSTGLKDKNGKEIYEGDIVSASIYGDETPQILKVYEAKGSFVIDYEDSENDLTTVGWFVGSFEVIGNIHDNPNLEAK